MAFIVNKRRGQKDYFYYTESGRVEGKPRIVKQEYIGTPNTIVDIVTAKPQYIQECVLRSASASFGADTILYKIIQKLGIVEIINDIFKKRNQGPSVGHFIMVAAINRVVSPVAKCRLPEWYEKSCLQSILGFDPKSFSGQNFWNNTSGYTQEQWQEAEIRIVERMIEIMGLDDVDPVIYDATNFFTFINTKNSRCTLAMRGHDKAKRKDLRTVGLSLTVLTDSGIPLLSHTYPGNRSDSTEFAESVKVLKKHFPEMFHRDSEDRPCIVYDKGNNSEPNLAILEDVSDGQTGFYSIGGINKTQGASLFRIPLTDYHPLKFPEDCSPEIKERMKDIKCFQVDDFSFNGRKVPALITFNPALKEGQIQGINLNIEKTEKELTDLQIRLLKRHNGEIKGGRKPTIDSLERSIGKILRREYMSRLFLYEITEEDGDLLLSFTFSEEKMVELSEVELGKTVIFTTKNGLSEYDMVHGYRAAWYIESGFRQMKTHSAYLRVRPIYCWTDPQIIVHMFICVLAYRICTVLHYELAQKNIHCSIDEMIEALSELNIDTLYFTDQDQQIKHISAFRMGNELAERIAVEYGLLENINLPLGEKYHARNIARIMQAKAG